MTDFTKAPPAAEVQPGRTIPVNFIDIETVSEYKSTVEFATKDIHKLTLFEKRFAHEADGRDESPSLLQVYNNRSGLYAEFGKIVCISMGKLINDKFFIKSCCSRNEKLLLTDFAASLSKANILCGHNIKEFDVPYIIRRMIINKVPVPSILNTFGLKAWEVQDKFLDTMQMWSSVQWNHKVSLELLCNLFGLQSPKKEMNGKSINDLYWSMFDEVKNTELPFDAEEKVLKQIATYCNGDVFAGANVYCCIKGIEGIREDQIVIA